MTDTLDVAFKEWAVICQALAEGRQSLILRKGGIAEQRGEFTVERRRFWLYPTWTHQQGTGVQDEAQPLLDRVLQAQPPAGIVRLAHFAEVVGIYHVMDELRAQMLAHLHLWSDDTVHQRFHYRQPGLHVLAVRVYRAAETELAETPAYQGCKSWVQLDRSVPVREAQPVLEEQGLADLKEQLDLLLGPTTLMC